MSFSLLAPFAHNFWETISHELHFKFYFGWNDNRLFAEPRDICPIYMSLDCSYHRVSQRT
jgi:hypothetical protein